MFNKGSDFYLKVGALMSSFIGTIMLTSNFIYSPFTNILIGVMVSMVIYMIGEKKKNNG